MKQDFTIWRNQILQNPRDISPLKFGISQDEVIEIFGNPDVVSTMRSDGKPLILKYHDIELHFDRKAPHGLYLVYSMRLHWFEDMDEDENRPYDMEEPNFFGLSIAYDPYMREVVQADRLTTCGGDGGCNICGGLGPFLGFLPCSPHCKPEVQEDNELNGDYDFYRPIIRLENYD